MKQILFSLTILFCAITSPRVQAAIKYWDGNSTTAGAGTAPAGTWSSSAFWSTASDGTATPAVWVSGDSAVFSAGTDATGSYTVTLGSANANAITVEEGTVILGGSGAVTLINSGPVTINAGATLSINSSVRMASTNGVITLNGGKMEDTNTGAAGSFVDVDQTIVLNGGGTVSHTTANILNIIQTTTTISGTGPLTKEGVGVLAIASACTYSGATIINAGELRIRTTTNRLPTGTDVTVNSPGILNLNGVSQQIGSLAGNGDVGLAGATLTIGGTVNTAYSGAIKTTANAGAGGSTATGGNVTKQGTGTLTLSGNNAYTGLLTLTAGGITVDSGGFLCDPICDVIVNGGTLTLNNTAQTIENLFGTGGTISLASGHTLSINPANANRSSTYSGTIAGSGSVTKIGANNAEILAGPNTYTGPTTVSAGKLFVAAPNATTGTYSVAAGAAFGAVQTTPGAAANVVDVALADGASLEFDFAYLAYPAAKLLNVGTIAVTATTPVNVKGFDTSGGPVTLLEYTGARSGTGSFTTGVLPPRVVGTITDDTANSKIIFNATGADTIVWVGDVSGNWDTNNPANATWKLATAGTATYYQETAVQGDSVRFDDTATGTTTVSLLTNLFPYKDVTVDNTSKNYTFTGTGKISGLLTSLTKSGTGQLTITTANNYGGGTTLNAGVLALGADSALGTGKLRINGSTIRSDSATAHTLSIPVDLNSNETFGDSVNNGDLTFQTGAWTIVGASRQLTVDTINATISSVIGQDVAGRGLTKAGGGTLSLTGANTFTGGFTHNAGTVRVNSTTALGAASSAVVLANGVTLSVTTTTARTLTYVWTVNGDVTLGQAVGGTSAVTLAGSMDLTGVTRTFTAATNATISAVITNGALTKDGPGTLTLSGANAYNGDTTANAGVVALTGVGVGTGGFIANTGGTIQLNGTGTLGNGSGTLTLAGGKLNTSANRSVTTAPVPNPINLTANSEITTTSTATTVNLNFTSSSITAGNVTLTFRNDGADGAADTFEPRFSGGDFTFSQPIVIDNGAVGKTRLNSFNTNTTTQTFSGVISGSGSFNRSASTSGTGGTTIFTGDNTYSGGTTINDGTLLVNNTSGSGTGSGTVTVTSGGTLGGTGTVGGAVIVESGGKIAPGASAGLITLQNGLDLSASATYAWELGEYSTTVSFDRVTLTGGNLVLGGTSKLSVNFTGLAASPHGGDAFWTSSHTWTVVNLSGGANPGDSDFFSVVNGVYTNGYFTTSVSGGNVLLNFTPGPSPQPTFTSLTGAGTTNVTINFNSLIKGATYQVQYKNDLNAAVWSVLGNVVATGSTASIIDTTAPAPAQRFYRIVVL